MIAPMVLRRFLSPVQRMSRAPMLVLICSSVANAQPVSDSAAITRIKNEAQSSRSEVMEIAQTLTDIHGPRLTGSPLDSLARVWAMQRMRTWGLERVHAEPFAFDQPSWLNVRFYLQVVAPSPFTVLAHPSAWSRGTDSLVRAEVVIARIRTAADTIRLAGTLRGKAVLVTPPMDVLSFAPRPVYWTEELLDRAQREGKNWYVQTDLLVETSRYRSEPSVAGARVAAAEVRRFLAREGVALELRTWGGAGGNFIVGATDPQAFPQVDVAPEHYNRIYRTVESGHYTSVEFDIRNQVSSSPANPFNVLADLPGTDRADEVVLIGGHLDSWTGGTGATDNAAGVAVMMEAMRILKTLALPLRRTVRIALWSGEEQGSIGSAAYIADHLVTTTRNGRERTHTPKPAAATFSGYFNLDLGAGAIRGVDTYGNTAVASLFDAWLGRIAMDSMSVRHVLSLGDNPSDDGAFDSVELPAFYFVQDPREYSRGTQHYSQDLFERLDPGILRHNATVVAAFIYLVANHDSMLPRKAAR